MSDIQIDYEIAISPDEQRLIVAAKRAAIKRIEFKDGVVSSVEFYESHTPEEKECALLLATNMHPTPHRLREAISKSIENRLRQK